MKKQQFYNLDPKDFQSELKKLRKELFLLKSASLSGEDVHKKKARIPSVKKSIAQVLTRLNRGN